MDDIGNPRVDPGEHDEPNKRLGFLIYRAGLAVSRGYERALKPLGVTPTEAGVLGALRYSGPNHVRGLGRLLGVGRQTIVNVTRALEAKEWIAREPADHDARLIIHVIAAEGVRQLTRIEQIAQSFDQALRDTISNSVEPSLVDELTKIVNAPFLAYED